MHQGGTWLETHVALVPTAEWLQNGFYKASSLVRVCEGAQRNDPQEDATCKGKGRNEQRTRWSLPALLLGFQVTARAEIGQDPAPSHPRARQR